MLCFVLLALLNIWDTELSLQSKFSNKWICSSPLHMYFEGIFISKLYLNTRGKLSFIFPFKCSELYVLDLQFSFSFSGYKVTFVIEAVVPTYSLYKALTFPNLKNPLWVDFVWKNKENLLFMQFFPGRVWWSKYRY